MKRNTLLYAKKKLPWLSIGVLIIAACGLAYLLLAPFFGGHSPAFGLDYYVQAQRLDPIFAIEGTDPQKLANAVNALLAQKERLVDAYGSKNSAIEHAVYPAAFLTGLPKLEAVRQALLREPTLEQARAYHDLLVQTIADYADNARALASALRDAATRIPTLGYLGGEASTGDMATKMDMAAELALQQKQKETDRFACVDYPSKNCTTLAALARARNAKLTTPAALPAPTQDVLRADTLTRRALGLYPNIGAISKTIFAIPTTCYPGSTTYGREYYLYDDEDWEARKFAYVNDAYFYDVPRIVRNNPSPVFAALQKLGVTVKYQSIGNLYECPDSGLDVTEVGSLVGVLNVLAQQAPLVPAEQKLLALPVVQKADLAAYVRAVAKLQSPLGDALVQRYIEGSADFDQIVLGIRNDTRYLQTWTDTPSFASFEFLLTARNFASTLFLLGNPTFVPTRISLFSKKEPSQTRNLYLRSYLDDVSKQYTDDEILAQFRTSIGVIGEKMRNR